MTAVFSTDPRTGVRTATAWEETTPDELDDVLACAADASARLVDLGREGRARLLDEIAREIEARADELCDTADAETGLGRGRLETEVARAANQFRLFAAVAREGSYLEAAIDHVEGAAIPDVRRMLVPVGPVAVFGASNFPFAFSVLGGDTASALAAGCAVVAKAHPAHPVTSDLSRRVIAAALQRVDRDAVAIQLVYGFEAGRALVAHPGIRAVTLTGSLVAARALQEVIDGRPDPIPFFAELGSINPLVVLPGAAAERGAEIADGLAASYLGSGGQLCTKPGVVFVPRDAPGDALVTGLRERTAAAPSAVMLTETIRDGFGAGVERMLRAGAVIAARGIDTAPAPGFSARPTLLELDADHLQGDALEECFGPALVVVRYDSARDLPQLLDALPGSLTTSLHVAERDREPAEALLQAVVPRSGRVVFDGYPTGVRVGWAQHHGGPWPSTNSAHTSVGATAIRRFLRPIAFQNAPQWALPAELRDHRAGVPRRVDGVLEMPG